MTLYEHKVTSYIRAQKKFHANKIQKIFHNVYNRIANEHLPKHLHAENCHCPEITRGISASEYTVVLAYASCSRYERRKLHWWSPVESLQILHHAPVIIGFSEKLKTFILMYLGGHDTAVGVWSFSLDNSDLKMAFDTSDNLFLSYKCELFSDSFKSSTLPIVKPISSAYYEKQENRDLRGRYSFEFEGDIFNEDPLLQENKDWIALLENHVPKVTIF